MVRRRRDVDDTDSDDDDDGSVSATSRSSKCSRSSKMSKASKSKLRSSSAHGPRANDSSSDDDGYNEPMAHQYVVCCQDAGVAQNPHLAELLASLDAQLEAGGELSLDLSRMHIGHRHVLLLLQVLFLVGCPVSHASFRACEMHSTVMPALVAALGARGSKIKSVDLSDNPNLSYMAARDVLSLVKARRKLVAVNLRGTAMHCNIQNKIKAQVDANKLSLERGERNFGGEISLEFYIPRSFLSIHFPPVLVNFCLKDADYVRNLCNVLSMFDPRLHGAFAVQYLMKTSPDYQEFIKSCFVEVDYLLVVASRAWCQEEKCIAETGWFKGRSTVVILPEVLKTYDFELEASVKTESIQDDEKERKAGTQESDEETVYQLIKLNAFHSQSSAYVPNKVETRQMECLRCAQEDFSEEVQVDLPFVLKNVPPSQRFVVPGEDLVASKAAADTELVSPSVRKVSEAITTELRSSQTFVLPPRDEITTLSRWQKAFVLVSQSLSADNPTHISLYPRLVRRLQQHRKEGNCKPFLPTLRGLTLFEQVVSEYCDKVKRENDGNDTFSSEREQRKDVVSVAAKSDKGKEKGPVRKAPSAVAQKGDKLRTFFDVDVRGRFFYVRGWRDWADVERPLSELSSLYIKNAARLRIRQILADEEIRVSKERAALTRESRALRISQRALASKVRLINRLENQADEDREQAGVPLALLLPHIDPFVIREVRSLKEPRLTDTVRMCARAVLLITDDSYDERHASKPLSWWWDHVQSAFALENQIMYKLTNMHRVRKRQWAKVKDFLTSPAYSLDSANVVHEAWAEEALHGARPRGAIALLARWVHCVYYQDRVTRRLEGESLKYIDELHDEYKDLGDQVTLQEQRVSLLQVGVGHLQQQVSQRIRQYANMSDSGDTFGEEKTDLQKPHLGYYERLKACQLFSTFPQRLLIHLALHCTLVSYDKKAELKPTGDLLVIMTGRVLMVALEGSNSADEHEHDEDHDPSQDAEDNTEADKKDDCTRHNRLRFASAVDRAALAAAVAAPATPPAQTLEASSPTTPTTPRSPASPLGMLSTGKEKCGTRFSTQDTEGEADTRFCDEVSAASAGESQTSSLPYGGLVAEQSLRDLSSARWSRSNQSRSNRSGKGHRMSRGSCQTDQSELTDLSCSLSAGHYLFDDHFLMSLNKAHVSSQIEEPIRCSSLGGPRGRPVSVLRISTAEVPEADRDFVYQTLLQNRESAVAKSRKVFFLQQLPFLRGLGVEVILCMATATKENIHAKGTTIAAMGATAGHLYIVCTGSIEANGDDHSGVFFPLPEDVLYGNKVAHEVRAGSGGCVSLSISAADLTQLCCTFTSLRGRINCKDSLGTEPPQQYHSGITKASTSLTPPRPWIDFNESFQELISLVPKTRAEAADRIESLNKLRTAFIRAAQPLAEIVITELHETLKKKTVQAARGGGNHPSAGGQLFVINGLLLEISPNKGNIFGGVGNAAKALKHELSAYQAILSTGIKGLCVPLTALVTFRGSRVKVTPILPIKGHISVIHGGVDGRGSPAEEGATYKNSPEISASLKGVCTMLNLKGHRLDGCKGLVYGPADLEVRRGEDGRLYVLRPGRLFPCPNIRTTMHTHGQWLYQRLRPEAVAQSRKPLSSDAFTRWGESSGADDLQVSQLCRHIQTKTIPEFATAFGEKYKGYVAPRFDGDLKSSVLAAPFVDLCSEAHLKGINVRCFSAVLTILPQEYSVASELLHMELVARTFKATLFASLRALVRTSAEAFEEEISRMLSETFGHGASNQVFWRDVLYPACKKKFGFEDLETYFEELPTMHICTSGVNRVEYGGFTAALHEIKRNPDLHMLLLARACELSGIQLATSDAKGHYDRLQELRNEQDRDTSGRMNSVKKRDRESIRSSLSSNSSKKSMKKSSKVKKQEDTKPFHFVEGVHSLVRCLVIPEDDVVDICLRTGRLDLATVHLLERIDIMESRTGEENASLVRPLHMLADVYGRGAQRTEQGVALQRALDLCIRDLPFDDTTGQREHSIGEVQALLLLGTFHERWGVVGKAAYLLKAAVHVLEDLGFDAQHDVMQACLFCLGSAEEKQLNHALAINVYETIKTKSTGQRSFIRASIGYAKGSIGKFELDKAEEELRLVHERLTEHTVEPENYDLLPQMYAVQWQLYSLKEDFAEAVPFLHEAIAASKLWVEGCSLCDIIEAGEALVAFVSHLILASQGLKQNVSRLDETLAMLCSSFPEALFLFPSLDVIREGCPPMQHIQLPDIETLEAVVLDKSLPTHRQLLACAIYERHLISKNRFTDVESLRERKAVLNN